MACLTTNPVFKSVDGSIWKINEEKLNMGKSLEDLKKEKGTQKKVRVLILIDDFSKGNQSCVDSNCFREAEGK